jgi:mercuric ion transport protein
LVGVVGAASTSLLATLCCVGPVAYAVLGAGGVLAAARLQPWRPWLLAVSAVFLALGFWSVYRRRVAVINGQACRVRTSRTARVILWVRRRAHRRLGRVGVTRRRLIRAAIVVAAVALLIIGVVYLRGIPGHTRPHQAVGAQAQTLREAFNANTGTVRIVALVSPATGLWSW